VLPDIVLTPNEDGNDEVSTVDVLVEKAPAKFKPGFSKVVAKKPQVSSFREDEKSGKKAKVFQHQKNSKYKNQFDADDSGFTRSTKLKAKKKEEKNIEDITQHLTTRTGETVVV
jgi:hypothetical protein